MTEMEPLAVADDNVSRDYHLHRPDPGTDSLPGLQIIVYTILLHVVCLVVSLKVINMTRGSRPNVGDKHKFLAAGQISRVPYSFVVVGFSIHALLNETGIWSHFIGWTTVKAEVATLITIGFHISDTVVIVLNDYIYGLRHKIFLLHHLLMLFLYAVIQITGQGYSYGIVFLLVEIIVPFITVQVVSIGLRIQVCDTLLFHLNNATVIHLFHLRHGFEFFLGLTLFGNWGSMMGDMASITWVCLVCHLVCMFVLITPYWTYHFTVSSLKATLVGHGGVVGSGVKRE